MNTEFKDLMNVLCGKIKLSAEDARWGELMEFGSDIFALNCEDEETLFYFRKIVENGQSSANMAILVVHITNKLSQLRINVLKKSVIAQTTFEHICSLSYLCTLILNYLFSTQHPNTIKKILAVNQAWPATCISQNDNTLKTFVDEVIHASCNYSEM